MLNDTTTTSSVTAAHAPAVPAAPAPRTSGWARAFMWVGMTAIIVAGLVGYFSIRAAVETGKAVADAPRALLSETSNAASDFLAGLRTQTITTKFSTYATRVEGTSRFQFADLKTTERLTRQNRASFMKIPLPEVSVEARFPVVYTYYVDFGKDWQFELDDKTLIVTAPRIEINDPAIDVSKLEVRTTKSSIWRREGKVEESLRADITRLTRNRANDSIALVREIGRSEITKFVQEWLLTQKGVFGETPDHPVREVRVQFANEVTPKPTSTVANAASADDESEKERTR